MATPGRYCPLGNTNSSGLLCPPGTYSNATGNVPTCIKCDALRPYSRAGASTELNCTACTAGGAACDDTLGVYACGDMGWTPWLDRDYTEGANSCLKPTASTGDWDTVNALCPLMAPSAHLLTTKQVQIAPLVLLRKPYIHKGRASVVM